MGAAASQQTAAPTGPKLTPQNLRCEYLVNPLGLGETSPRLSWNVIASERSQKQTAYQVCVASSLDLLLNSDGDPVDLWDSGVVTSDETNHIVYSGATLVSQQMCYWRVRVFDKSGDVSEWSTPAQWQMGILFPSQWHAKWITAEFPHVTNAACRYMRKEFEIGTSAPIQRAVLYATALGIYEARINGQRVGNHLFAPDWTNYNKRVRYQAYDVTSMLVNGTNAIGAMVAHGWFSGHIGNGGNQAWGKTPAFLAQLEVTYNDGTSERLISDDSWRHHASPTRDSDIMMGEDYDARLEIDKWDCPGLNMDAGTDKWLPCKVREEFRHNFEAQTMEPVIQLAELAAKTINEPLKGHWVFDLGQNMVGVIRLKISAPEGTKLTLKYAEMLNEDGTMYLANLRGAKATDHYYCKGVGVETWQPRFTFHGFRFVEIIGLDANPGLDAVTGIVFGTATPQTGQFSCSDDRINQLQSNIQWGQRGNYLSVPTDCPQRDERMGWMGDAQVFIRTATYNADVAAFYTKWMVDVDDAQHSNGAYADIAPDPLPNEGGVPGWADAGVICPWTIYEVYGDKRILERHLPAMMRWVDYQKDKSKNLIRQKHRGNDYGDWLSQYTDTPKELIGTAFFAYSTKLVAQSCRALGRNEDAEKYENLFLDIKTAFNKRYVSTTGRVQGYTQTCYLLALKFDLLPENLRQNAATYLAQDVVAKDNHLTTGFMGVSYLLPVLTQFGKVDTSYDLLLQDTFPSWLFSVKHGATTIWERWDGWTPENGFQDPGMNSFNHYSLGSCGEYLFANVAGIQLGSPGYKTVRIQPAIRPGLSWAKAHYDSIQGRISSSWKQEGTTLKLDIEIPANTTGMVYIPTTKDFTYITEGGKPITSVPDVKFVSAGDGTVILAVGSGIYNFVINQ